MEAVASDVTETRNRALELARKLSTLSPSGEMEEINRVTDDRRRNAIAKECATFFSEGPDRLFREVAKTFQTTTVERAINPVRIREVFQIADVPHATFRIVFHQSNSTAGSMAAFNAYDHITLYRTDNLGHEQVLDSEVFAVYGGGPQLNGSTPFYLVEAPIDTNSRRYQPHRGTREKIPIEGCPPAERLPDDEYNASIRGYEKDAERVEVAGNYRARRMTGKLALLLLEDSMEIPS